MSKGDYATALKHWWPLANPHVNNPIINRIPSPKGKCNQTTNKCRTRSRSYFLLAVSVLRDCRWLMSVRKGLWAYFLGKAEQLALELDIADEIEPF